MPNNSLYLLDDPRKVDCKCYVHSAIRIETGVLQILSAICYMIYQTDLFISFNRNATKCKPKKYFSHKGRGANMYQFHKMHTHILWLIKVIGEVCL